MPFAACDKGSGGNTNMEKQSTPKSETLNETNTESEVFTEPAGDNEADSERTSEIVSEASNESGSETHTETLAGTETETENKNETESETTAMDLVDFVVSIEEGRVPVILHITDTQIIDATQERAGDPVFGSTMKPFWGPDKLEDRCFKQLRETINATKPDLIIFTGDLVYGKWDDNGSCFLALVEFMESFGIPWAPVFGNHDNESKMGVDWQCEQLEKAENCLFLQRNLTGNGNYTVGIEQGGKLIRVFYMLDSNGCGLASDESMANGHTKKNAGFGNDQLAWCQRSMDVIKKASPDTKISYAFHIQLSVFAKGFEKYGYVQGGDRINIDTLTEKYDGDLGYIGAGIKSNIDTDEKVWNMLKRYGVDSIFVGHEHSNNASIVYEGVRLQYGQKSSEYDRYNFVDKNGEISTAQRDPEKTSLVGGTVFTLAADGSINTPWIYYAGFENGQIDWKNDFVQLPDSVRYIMYDSEIQGSKVGAYQLSTSTGEDEDGTKFRRYTGKDMAAQSIWAREKNPNPINVGDSKYLVIKVRASGEELSTFQLRIGATLDDTTYTYGCIYFHNILTLGEWTWVVVDLEKAIVDNGDDCWQANTDGDYVIDLMMFHSNSFSSKASYDFAVMAFVSDLEGVEWVMDGATDYKLVTENKGTGKDITIN